MLNWNSHFVRMIVLFFTVLLLQIPVLWIAFLTGERTRRHDEAVEEITAKWGKKQTLTGPAMVVPYLHRVTVKRENASPEERVTTCYAVFLPSDLHVGGSVTTELRSRGIYSVPVYKGNLDIRGTFEKPDASALGIADADLQWDRAVLAFGITDARAIHDEIALEAGADKVAFMPGIGEYDGDVGSGIHAPIGLRGRSGFDFHFPLQMNGSQAIQFRPFGRTTRVELESNWPSPSFQGNWLPQRRSTSGHGFSASWNIPYLGRNFPQSWTSISTPGEAIAGSAFGADLVETVTVQRMAERSVKYASLFLILTFTAVWLTEIVAGARVHPIQYIMIGAALCLFFLLELSLAEQLGFGLAYVLAAVGVVGMITAYARSVFGSMKRGLATGGVVAALYLYLYVLLANEDYALLVGSLGLFVVLGIVMFVTRRVDWFGKEQPQVKKAA